MAIDHGLRQVHRRWFGECDCGRLVSSVAKTDTTAPGVWIRCSNCGHTNWVTDYCAPADAPEVDDD